MGSQAPYGYGPPQPGWYVDPQDASTWPSGGRQSAYPPEPLPPLWPAYPPSPPPPSRPYHPSASSAPPRSRGSHAGRRPSRAPQIVEVLGGFFGFYGLGWIVGGYAVTGALLLVGSFLLALLWIVVTLATVGVGLFCIIPIDLVILATSALTLNARLKRRALAGERR